MRHGIWIQDKRLEREMVEKSTRYYIPSVKDRPSPTPPRSTSVSKHISMNAWFARQSSLLTAELDIAADISSVADLQQTPQNTHNNSKQDFLLVGFYVLLLYEGDCFSQMMMNARLTLRSIPSSSPRAIETAYFFLRLYHIFS